MRTRILKLLLWLIRKMGAYRVWRMFHEMAVDDKAYITELCEYIFKQELPERYLRPSFVAYWMGDQYLNYVLRKRSVALDSPYYPVRVYAELQGACRREGLTPRRVMEIGPGVHLGVLFCFAAFELDHVAGMDVTPSMPDWVFYERLKEYFAVAGDAKWWRYPATVNPHPQLTHPLLWDDVCVRDILDRIDYHSPASAEAMPFESASFNLVYSITAFEHFPDPTGAVKEIYRVLEPGGLTIHEIDFRHHLDMRNHQPKEALNFLEWTDRQHAAISEQYGDGKGLKGLLQGEWGKEVYCNRLRLSDCVDLFKHQGFEIVTIEPLELLDPKAIDRRRFVEPFRSKSLEDLSVLMARIVARKITR